MRWTGVVAMEGVATGDGRIVLPGAISMPKPVPLIDGGNNYLGVCDSIERGEGGEVYGFGTTKIDLLPGTGVSIVCAVVSLSDDARFESLELQGVCIDPNRCWPAYTTISPC